MLNMGTYITQYLNYCSETWHYSYSPFNIEKDKSIKVMKMFMIFVMCSHGLCYLAYIYTKRPWSFTLPPSGVVHHDRVHPCGHETN